MNQLIVRTIRNFIFFVILVNFSSAVKANECSELFRVTKQQVGKSEIKVLELKDDSVLDVYEVFGKEGVFLGIQKGGHFYLIVGGTRFDGSYMYTPMRAVDGERNSDGYLIHFPDIPKEKVDEWIANFEEGAYFFSLSCVSAACGALRDGFDINVGGVDMMPVFMGRSFNQILREGFVDSEGNPLQFTIYRTSNRVPEIDLLQSKLFRQDVIQGVIELRSLIFTVAVPFFIVYIVFNSF